MTPGRMAYERVREELRLPEAWSELSDDERSAWEAGASLPPVHARANIADSSDSRST